MDVVISSQFTSNFHHSVAFPEIDDVDVLYEQKWQNNTFPSFLIQKVRWKISVDLL